MTVSGPETFLTKILDHKRTEVARQAMKIPLEQLQSSIAISTPPRSFSAALRQPGQVSLIAEVKKASPSKGVLIENFDPLALARTYAENGAAAISVLTDTRFFQGSLKYLQGIRALSERGWELGAHDTQPPLAQTRPTPLLRKDFIIDSYQVYEARAYGADAILLIVAALDDATLATLLEQTYALGMQALVEVHNATELDRALALGATIVGINNRNLHTFVTTLETTQQLAERLPSIHRPLLISESGITNAADIARVHSWGVDAVLVGEALVVASDTAGRVRELVGATSSL